LLSSNSRQVTTEVHHADVGLLSRLKMEDRLSAPRSELNQNEVSPTAVAIAVVFSVVTEYWRLVVEIFRSFADNSGNFLLVGGRLLLDLAPEIA
jgi:hypothetical protein